MSKIFNKLIVLGLIVISAFGIIPAIRANAQNLGGFVVTGGYNPPPPPPIYIPVPQPVYVPTYVPVPQPIPVPQPVPVYIAPAPAPTPTVYSNSANPNPPIAKKVAAKPKPKETASELTASSIYGDDTFLPSGLVQWILFAILVLLIVILVRKIYGADARYHAVPLKHD